MAEKNFFDDSNLKKGGGGGGADETSLAALQQQIEQHEKHIDSRSYLNRAISVVWHKDSDSLDKLKELEKKAQTTGGAGYETQIKEAIQADKKAASSEDDVLRYAGGFVKTVPLFMSGKGMLAATVGLYAIDQMNPNDSLGTQITDGVMGGLKGGLTKATFDLMGNKPTWGFATKGLFLGTTSRVIDQGLTRQTYLDPGDGSLSLTSAANGLKNVAVSTFNPTALATDVIVFGAGHGLFKAGNALTGNLLERSPLLANMSTGLSFGVTGGALGEVERQRQAGEAFDPIKVATRGLLQGGLDAVAAAPGGLRAQYGFSASAHPTVERSAVQGEKFPVARSESGLSTTLTGITGGEGFARTSITGEVPTRSTMIQSLDGGGGGGIKPTVGSGLNIERPIPAAKAPVETVEKPFTGGGNEGERPVVGAGAGDGADGAWKQKPPAKLELDLRKGVQLMVGRERYVVDSVDEHGNVTLKGNLTKTVGDLDRVKQLNGVSDLIMGHEYKLMRTGRTEPQDGWIYNGGMEFKKLNETTKVITPAEYAAVVAQNPHAAQVGQYRLNDKVQLPNFEVGQVAGFDGEDLVIYRAQRVNGRVDVRRTHSLDNYRELNVPGYENLYQRVDGRVFQVTPAEDGSLRAMTVPELEIHKTTGSEAVQRISQQLKVGDLVETGSKSYPGRLAGYDPQTGNAIVFRPSEEKLFGPPVKVPDLKGYREITVQDTHLYIDKNGSFWTAGAEGGGYQMRRVFAYASLEPAQVRPGRIPGDVIERKDIDMRPVLPDDVRPKIPASPLTGQGEAPIIDPYKGAELRVNGNSFVAFDAMNGKPVAIGRDTLGMSDSKYISEKHADVRWDPEQQMYVYEDHSTNGTFIRRAGSADYTFIRGTKDKPASVYIGPGDEIRLGKRDGAELRIFSDNVGAGTSYRSLQDAQVFFDGKEVNMQGNQLILGRKHQEFGNAFSDVLNRRVSNDHVKLQFIGGKWVIEDLTRSGERHDGIQRTVMVSTTRGNGTIVVHADGTETHLIGEQLTLKEGDKIHLGSRNGPELKIVTALGKELPDGRVTLTRENGETVYKRPDGTTQVVDRFGMSRIEDTQGRVIQAVADLGNQSKMARNYSYGEKGELEKITFADKSTISSSDGKNWVRTKSDGTTEPWWKGKIEVETDGSLKYSDGYKPPRVTIERLDGSREVVDEHGRVTYQNVDFAKEVAYMNEVRDKFENPSQRSRFKQLMNDFEQRAKSDGLSKEEKAQTFHQVRRLLLAGDGAMLSGAERGKLAEQILYQAAHPETIDQGSNNTCNVTTVEKRIFSRNPSEAARLIADVALTGKYVTADGTIVDLSRVPGALQADAEARRLERSFDSKDRDIRIDGARSRASQIFELGAVNIKYAQQHKADLNAVVVYEKPAAGLKGQEQEQLVRYTVDFTGKLERKVLDDSPDIAVDDLRGIHNQVVGGDEGGFVIMGPKFRSRKTGKVYETKNNFYGAQDVRVADNPGALGDMLLKMQADRKMPAILYVDAANTFFGGDGGGSGGGGHVINVQRIYRDSRGRTMVDFTNQWGAKNNRSVSIEQLFSLTMPPGVK